MNINFHHTLDEDRLLHRFFIVQLGLLVACNHDHYQKKR